MDSGPRLRHEAELLQELYPDHLLIPGKRGQLTAEAVGKDGPGTGEGGVQHAHGQGPSLKKQFPGSEPRCAAS